jgi:ribulose-bisphosphate carboxylase small chain
MKLTQGAFSFLPDLTDAQISKQIQYAINKSWAVSIEYTDDPHPRNSYWEMWGLPLFDIKDPAAILFELNMCTFIHRSASCLRAWFQTCTSRVSWS